MKNNYVADIKIIVVGNSYTGKTSFVKRWTGGKFQDKYKATIISQFGCKTINLNGLIYNIHIWDIAGQDRSPTITKLFVKDSTGAIVMADATDEKSLEDTTKWKNEIFDKINYETESNNIPVMLLQNKIDLISEQEKKDNERVLKKLIKEHNFSKFFQISAKTGKNVNEAMGYIISEIIDRLKVNNLKRSNASNTNFLKYTNISERSGKEDKKCC